MHHSADPSAEAVHHRRRDGCDSGNRTSETEPKGFPEKRIEKEKQTLEAEKHTDEQTSDGVP
ncbi:Uncharacterized protein DAT39_021101 [Clarias magur]|uniref:Uncharacterized protein n=1 Tax=Clarias magur TaxID=1594786 RepID=A0A8J4TXW1_CLAMG|nr:Uncharacterized protein DAT39_021101 [Clarias magur]